MQPAPIARDVASGRTPGFDVARAFAILGMVLVNFRAMAAPEDLGPKWMVHAVDLFEGKAAALFVTLAGVGVTLRLQSARRRRIPVETERRALFRRAAVLFALGLVNLHMWEWDILHCYGVYLVLAALIMDASATLLWVIAGLVIVVAAQMQAVFDYERSFDFWEAGGAVADLGFNGLFPAFPWFAFVVLGILLARLDLRNGRVRAKVAAAALVVGITLEAINPTATAHVDAQLGTFTHWSWLSTWPRPAGPAFVLSGGAWATLVILACIQVTDSRPSRRWVLALTATGQLALTIYVAHAIAILMPLEHGTFDDGLLSPVLAYGLMFFAMAVALSYRWRTEHRYGPLELLVRQLASRRAPAPWGGRPLAQLADGQPGPTELR